MFVAALHDCLLFKQGSTIGDVYEALKRGAIKHTLLQGEFVRAEGRPLQGGGGGGGKSVGRKQLGKDTVLSSDNCVLRIQTNKKSLWQKDARQGEA